MQYVGKVATIEELIIGSKYRGNGKGKILVNKAIDYAKSKNCDVIELTSGFSEKKSHKFYENSGFTKISYKFKMEL